MLTESDLKMVIRSKAHALRERTAKAPVIGSDGQPHVQGQGNPATGGEGRRGRSGESHGAGHEKKNISLVN